MKTVVTLLLLCLCDPGQSDCLADCLTCIHILPKQLTFNPMVCLAQCEDNVSPASYLDFCRDVLSSQIRSFSSALQKEPQEDAGALFPNEGEDEEVEGDLSFPIALQRFNHMTRALEVGERDLGGKEMQLSTALHPQNALSLEDDYQEEAEQEEGTSDMAARGQDSIGLTISKRFGGFVKGRHSYRKLVSPGKSYQKRFGGFIGIRKSARKWNNQKRFSEILKQYFGMSPRSTDFDNMSEDINQQNKV